MQPTKWITIFFASQVTSITDSGSYSIVDYIDLVGVYSIFRHISRWTHLTCHRSGEFLNLFEHPERMRHFFSQWFNCRSIDQNIEIEIRLSLLYNIQSRFVRQFDTMKRLMDTPNTYQGFVVDTTCSGYEHIFQKVSIFQAWEKRGRHRNSPRFFLHAAPSCHRKFMRFFFETIIFGCLLAWKQSLW